jgi:glycosyltransferase involved in cell wall biosynthesis
MKLIAALICRNEKDRFLGICVSHLLEYVDEVVILDDASTDGWQEAMRDTWGEDGSRVIVQNHREQGRNQHPAFHKHAAARNRLLQFALSRDPSHILQIDCDELVSDGAAVRRSCEGPGDLFSLTVQEVWSASERALFTREDGGWRSHEIGIVWRVGAFGKTGLLIADRGHATGRVPASVNRARMVKTGAQLLHFGWTNVPERAERYARYRDGDGGKFHASAHIQSIMWSARRVRLVRRGWPMGLAGRQDELLARVNRP